MDFNKANNIIDSIDKLVVNLEKSHEVGYSVFDFTNNPELNLKAFVEKVLDPNTTKEEYIHLLDNNLSKVVNLFTTNDRDVYLHLLHSDTFNDAMSTVLVRNTLNDYEKSKLVSVYGNCLDSSDTEYKYKIASIILSIYSDDSDKAKYFIKNDLTSYQLANLVYRANCDLPIDDKMIHFNKYCMSIKSMNPKIAGDLYRTLFNFADIFIPLMKIPANSGNPLEVDLSVAIITELERLTPQVLYKVLYDYYGSLYMGRYTPRFTFAQVDNLVGSNTRVILGLLKNNGMPLV